MKVNTLNTLGKIENISTCSVGGLIRATPQLSLKRVRPEVVEILREDKQ